jgi:ATP-dependent helicase/nuclease subunit A
VDERTNTVFYESEDDESRGDTDDRDGETDPTRLPPTVFGEMVHRLCELRPPDERWNDVIEQVFEAEDTPGELTTADRERVVEHANRAIDFVDDRHAESDIIETYDELPVTAEFDTGEVSGVIDHLLVTPSQYHIIDYKTNDVEASEVGERADYYRAQMEPYAIALHQQDPARGVTAWLFFTTPGEARKFVWTPGELDALRTNVVEEIERNVGRIG